MRKNAKNAKPITDYKVGEPGPTTKVAFVPRTRFAPYGALVCQIGLLKIGQSLPVKVPVGVLSRTFSQRITAALRHAGVRAPSGYMYTKRMAENDYLMISVEAGRRGPKRSRK